MSISKQSGQTPILDVPPDTIGGGQKTVTTAGSRVQLTTTDTPCRRIFFIGLQGMQGACYIGGSGVSSTNGVYIYAGQIVTIDIDNLNKIYLDADNNGGGVNYTYVE